jgi:tetratricopeptide (TPR) repeat protein
MHGRAKKADASAERRAGTARFNAGRFEEALACFLRARSLGDRSAGLGTFIAHARASAGRPGARLKLEELRARGQAALSAGDAGAAEALLRAALARKPSKASRRAITDVLRACGDAHRFAGRLEEAARVFRSLLKEDPRDAAACLSLAAVMRAAGRPARERALLSHALSADRGSLKSADRFRALMKLGRYKAAIAQAEGILDAGPALEDVRVFWDPWEWDDRRPREDRVSVLRKLERALAGSRTPWLRYYSAELLEPSEGLAHFEALSAYPRARYGWMFAKAGLAAHCAALFEKAAAWFQVALESEPADWRTNAFLAEVHLCLGKPAMAFREMDAALRAAPPEDAAQIIAWRGALELWTGRYEEALATLEEACRRDAPCAFGWRGAALLKLGRKAEALARLDETLRRFPRDFESYVWRGEARREMGLYREALADLNEEALADPKREPPIWLWALVNRALVRKALGDAAGFETDFAALPAYFVDHIRARTGLKDKEAVLRAGLELSRGFRREEYRQAIWMT